TLAHSPVKCITAVASPVKTAKHMSITFTMTGSLLNGKYRFLKTVTSKLNSKSSEQRRDHSQPRAYCFK
ncbi:hypothetical protein BaRGS_00027444, partial [Batillaria attramentaria]